MNADRSGDGTPLYWVAADGTQRDHSDPPPREDWHEEMKAANPA